MDGQGRKYIIRLYVREIRLIMREKEKYETNERTFTSTSAPRFFKTRGKTFRASHNDSLDTCQNSNCQLFRHMADIIIITQIISSTLL